MDLRAPTAPDAHPYNRRYGHSATWGPSRRGTMARSAVVGVAWRRQADSAEIRMGCQIGAGRRRTVCKHLLSNLLSPGEQLHWSKSRLLLDGRPPDGASLSERSRHPSLGSATQQHGVRHRSSGVDGVRQFSSCCGPAIEREERPSNRTHAPRRDCRRYASTRTRAKRTSYLRGSSPHPSRPGVP